ncbi:MAG: wax ester/triacylglycerol synthase domain-containing protein [Ilumatobacteraceae bacterium]
MSPTLSPLETILWRAGQDPILRMTVGNLIILDARPDLDDLVDRLATVAQAAPRLAWRLDDPTRTRTRPGWAANPTFDARDHVRLLAIPAPGDLRQVLDLVGLVDATQFETSRSPWDLTVIEGLEGGRAALYLRADHVLTDGVGGVELMKLLLDAPEPVVRAAPSTFAATTVPSSDDEGEVAPVAPSGAVFAAERKPGTVTMTLDLTTLARPVAAGIGVARHLDPGDAVDTVVRGVQRGVGMVNSVSRQLVVAGGALSTLTPSGSMGTRFEVLSVPGARAAAVRLGGSRNVLLVAAVAAGLGDYHQRLGRSVGELRMASPILVRAPRSGGGNSFAPMRVEVPATVGHPSTHFGVVADRLARARREPAMHLTGPLTTAINLLPSRLLVPAARAQIGTIDFIATTLPGSRTFGAVCGVGIHGSYPFGPRAGRLVNITALGNGDRLDLGIALDPGAIKEPDVFLECLEAAFARLIDTTDRSDPGA